MIQRCSLTRWLGGAMVALSVLGAAGLPVPARSATSRAYDFTVFLGTDEIGRQRFEVSSEGERTRIRIEARFTVRFLYIPVYTYRHTNVEIWEGACLREIRAETDDNGASFFVRGSAQYGRMLVRTQDGDWSAEGCVRTFAYWNLDWLTGGRLLNSQTGDMQAAEIRTAGTTRSPYAVFQRPRRAAGSSRPSLRSISGTPCRANGWPSNPPRPRETSSAMRCNEGAMSVMPLNILYVCRSRSQPAAALLGGWIG